MGDLVLGIEGGGTRTVALLANTTGRDRRRREFGPLNLQLATDREVLAVLRACRAPQPDAVAICLAGCRTAADRARLRRLSGRVFPRVPAFIGNDLDSGLAAAFGVKGAGILVISGTGSCVVGRRAGAIARAGGWGHVLGDHGSGYWIALTGLRNAIREYDRAGQIRPALRRVLRRLGIATPEQLVAWAQDASKNAIAAVAGDVLRGDQALRLQAASFLAMDAAAVARKLGVDRSGALPVALAGGVLRHETALRRVLRHRLRLLFPRARIALTSRESAWGAVRLAQAVRGRQAEGEVTSAGRARYSRSRGRRWGGWK